MRIALRPSSRWPRIPLGIAAFAVLWATTVAISRIVAHYTGFEPDLCLFHRLTGSSCPTCGTTRAALALLRGDWTGALAWNPLMLTVGAVGALVLAGRMLTGKAVSLHCDPSEWRILRVLGLAALALNWAWLLRTHP